jgi:ubiquinone/menaquinone biosynthesis C-methylase UbiE
MIQGVTEMREAYRDDRVAAAYIGNRFQEPLGALLHRRQADVVRDVVATYRPDRVLEIAPGPARLTFDVAPLLRRPPVLIDASAQMLGQAKSRLASINQRAEIINGDAFQLPFSPAFDLAYSFRLIRHFEAPERSRLYSEIHHVLRPEGLLVFDAVNSLVSAPLRAKSKPGEHCHYDALLRPETLTAELQAAGFHVLSLIPVQRRYPMLSRVQVYVAPRSRALARGVMEILDRSGGEPLEWVVVCRRA